MSTPQTEAKKDGQSTGLALAPGSPPFSFAERMANVAYKRSASVDDPQNANADWRAGYAVGRYTDAESMGAIAQEWSDRGEPNGKNNTAFVEWKIGFWAGRFTRLDERHADALANIEGQRTARTDVRTNP